MGTQNSKPTMLRSIRFFLVLALLLIGAHRLPAPISEAQPATPAPKQKQAAPRSKPKSETASKSKPSSSSSFAGTWTGTVAITASSGVTIPNSAYVLKVSDDEKTVWINWNPVGQSITGPGYQAPCNRFRETLTWSPPISNQVVTDTLRMSSSGTANFLREGRWTGGDYEGVTYTHSGTFARQSVSSSSSTNSSPQTTSLSTKSGPTSPGDAVVNLTPSGTMSGPKPEAPPEARAQHLSGRGIFLLHFDKPTGNLINVTVSQSTGSAILDQAAIATLQKWHATPGCPREVPMTVTYSSQ